MAGDSGGTLNVGLGIELECQRGDSLSSSPSSQSRRRSSAIRPTSTGDIIDLLRTLPYDPSSPSGTAGGDREDRATVSVCTPQPERRSSISRISDMSLNSVRMIKDVVSMLVHDKQEDCSFKAHNTYVNKAGRLKMIHCTSEEVQELWGRLTKKEDLPRFNPMMAVARRGRLHDDEHGRTEYQSNNGKLSEQMDQMVSVISSKSAAKKDTAGIPEWVSELQMVQDSEADHDEDSGGEEMAHRKSERMPTGTKLSEEALAPTEMIEFDITEVIIQEDDKQQIKRAHVRRAGRLDGILEAEWKIVNGNIDPKYFHQVSPRTGVVRFGVGENMTSFELPHVEDPTWNIDAFYVVKLSLISASAQLNKGSRPVLGRNSKLLVYFVNVEYFPVDVEPGTISMRMLVLGFLWHNFTEIPRAATCGLLLALFPGIAYILRARLLSAQVNCVGSADSVCKYLGVTLGTDSVTVMLIMAVMQLLIFTMSFLTERTFRRLRLEGRTKRKLRSNLFVVMMHMAAEKRCMYDQGDIPKVLDTDVETAINEVWLKGFGLFSLILTLIGEVSVLWYVAMTMMGTMTMLGSLLLGASSLILCIGMSLIMFSSNSYFHKFQELRTSEEKWHALVHMCEECRSVIAAYYQFDSVNVTVDEAHDRINKALIELADYTAQHVWFLRTWFVLVSVAVAVLLGVAVREDSTGVALDVGTFVMVQKAIGDFGRTLNRIAQHFRCIFASAASVEKISEILNQDTVRKQRLRMSSDCEFPEVADVWESSLVLLDVEYVYPEAEGRPAYCAVKPLRALINPGQLVCFPRHKHGINIDVGINTLFKLIAGQLLPTSGYLLYPKRWRVVYVPLLPVLFNGTLMYNLCFGCYGDTRPLPEADLVWRTCERVGMSKELIGNAEYDVGIMGENLKLCDRLLVSLVRALLFDVEVLLVSSVLDVLGEEGALTVLTILSEYIRFRGLQDHQLHEEFRHRKTVMYTTGISALQKEICNSWLEVEETVDTFEA